MLSTLTLNDKDSNAVTIHAETGKRAIVTASGLFGIEAPRDSRRVRPTAHGGIDETRWGDGRLISIDGEVMSNVSVEDADTELHAVLKPMVETLDYGAALLKWRVGVAGLQLQRLVKLASDVDPPVQLGAQFLYQAQFFAEDPRSYSQTLQTIASTALSQASGGLTFPMRFPIKFTPSGGGSASVNNGGNRKTPPVLRIYGQCTDPQILHVESGDRIVLSGTVSAGDYLELDVARRTVKLNGSVNRANFLSSSVSTWFELPAGASTLRLLASSFDVSARLDVVFRDAYA